MVACKSCIYVQYYSVLKYLFKNQPYISAAQLKPVLFFYINERCNLLYKLVIVSKIHDDATKLTAFTKN